MKRRSFLQYLGVASVTAVAYTLADGPSEVETAPELTGDEVLMWDGSKEKGVWVAVRYKNPLSANFPRQKL